MAQHNSQDKVSIRLVSGGHSFSDTELRDALASGKDVEVEFITPRSVLVPSDMALAPADALHASGITLKNSECAVATPAIDGRVAVMAIDAEQHHRLEQMLGEHFCYASPLAEVNTKRDGVSMMLCNKTLYMHIVTDGVLCFSEALMAENEADILYYLERCNEVYLIYNKVAYITGECHRLKPLTGRVFRSVVCE